MNEVLRFIEIEYLCEYSDIPHDSPMDVLKQKLKWRPADPMKEWVLLSGMGHGYLINILVCNRYRLSDRIKQVIIELLKDRMSLEGMLTHENEKVRSQGVLLAEIELRIKRRGQR